VCTCHFTPPSRDAPALARVFFWAKEKGAETFYTKDFFLGNNGPKLSYLKGNFIFLKWPYLDRSSCILLIYIYTWWGFKQYLLFSLTLAKFG